MSNIKFDYRAPLKPMLLGLIFFIPCALFITYKAIAGDDSIKIRSFTIPQELAPFTLWSLSAITWSLALISLMGLIESLKKEKKSIIIDELGFHIPAQLLNKEKYILFQNIVSMQKTESYGTITHIYKTIDGKSHNINNRSFVHKHDYKIAIQLIYSRTIVAQQKKR